MASRLDADFGFLWWVATCLSLLLPPARAYPWEEPALEKFSDLNVLRRLDIKEAYAQLIRRGEKAFPSLVTVLSDEKATRSEVLTTLGVIARVKADRSRFHGHAVGFLRHSDPEVRWAAVKLLEQIGTEKDTATLYPMMTDPELVVRYAAPKAIAAIGGRRDLAKLNKLLQANKFQDGDDYRAKLEKYRDAMKKRLDALDKAKGVVRPEP
jgi:hypothetical protein